MTRLRTWARQLKRDTYALYLAVRDPRTPWYARILAGVILAYAFSPIDLIPDFIPVLGYLDDVVLVPLGLALLVRLVPPEVMTAARLRAAEEGGMGRPTSRVGAATIVLVWLALATWGVRLDWDVLQPR